MLTYWNIYDSFLLQKKEKMTLLLTLLISSTHLDMLTSAEKLKPHSEFEMVLLLWLMLLEVYASRQ